jgi:subtilase family serine protease
MNISQHSLTRKRVMHLFLGSLTFLLTACAGIGSSVTIASATPTPAVTPTVALSPTAARLAADTCPEQLELMPNCQTPHSMRVAYGMESLIEQGFTGKGETVVDIVSYGSPTLQQDVDTFDRQFGLPPITIQVQAPIGTAKPDPTNKDIAGWAEETTLDVELIHAMAPGAGILVLTSPVDETEGEIGMPQFLQLEQYAVKHKLGQIFSQSYVASEPTLADPQSRALVQTYDDFYQQIASQGWSVFTGSGDHGATDYINLASTKISPTPIVNFPADIPWVTAVGGTDLVQSPTGVNETAWGNESGGSGGGFSTFFREPDYQKTLPANVQTQLNGQRGVPDVAANADPSSAMAVYFDGAWQQIGGTSAATPTWAGIIAVADQMAGHPLGLINPGLYKIETSAKAASDFRDITSGNNSFSQNGITVKGYQAAPGWDPVTGLGAPIGDKLLPDLITALAS